MKVRGAAIGNYTVTPDCQQAHGGAEAALDEAFRRAREDAREHLEAADDELLTAQDFRLVLTVDTDRDALT